jgi:flagellar biosynthetic protein FliR
VLEVSSDQLQLWLSLFLWPMCRISAFLLSDPLLGNSNIPTQAKIGLAALISVLLGPNLPPLPEVAVMSWEGLGIMVEQVLIGLSLGMAMRITLAAVEMAGDICGMQMGLGFASFFSTESNTNSMVLSRLLKMITLLMFFALNGHLLVLELLAGTFTSLPIGNLPFNPGAWDLIARYGSTIFLTALLLALPMVMALLIINLSLGILNRSAPQLTVFTVGFPVSLGTGLVVLMALTSDLGQFLGHLLHDGIQFIQQLIETLALPA